ncbi:MAG TPA: exo-alpha-sialidase [Candidatus Hydrogenedentes bacterium]|nr:exo-alpha-sialidase [Candidatus Hydrogenedentota bacterium]
MKIMLVLSLLFMVVSGGRAAAEGFEARHIFPPQEKHVHGSSIVEAPNGDLLAAWFHGSGERTADDVLIQGARLRRGETNWSNVFVMADTPGFPDCNPVLFIDPQDRLWLFWVSVLANRWENCLLKYRRATHYSEDGPPEWDWQDVIQLRPGEQFPEQLRRAFKELGAQEGMWAEYAHPYTRMLVEAAHDKLKRQIGWMTRTQPLVLASGRILLPLYSDGFNVSLMAYTDDGENWRASAPIVGFAPIQPAVAQRKDGSIVAFCRDSGDAPTRIHRAESRDNGETWTVSRKTELPNPGASIAVRVLADGRWALIYNDTEDGRHRLAAALSKDEGNSWPVMRHLEKTSEDAGSFSYPSVIQAKDGRVHVSYSWRTQEGASIKHAVFSPEWVAGE